MSETHRSVTLSTPRPSKDLRRESRRELRSVSRTHTLRTNKRSLTGPSGAPFYPWALPLLHRKSRLCGNLGIGATGNLCPERPFPLSVASRHAVHCLAYPLSTKRRAGLVDEILRLVELSRYVCNERLGREVVRIRPLACDHPPFSSFLMTRRSTLL